MNKTISNILQNREWKIKFSFSKRNCYFSGKNLRFTWCYRGRKPVWNLWNGFEYYDDMWLSDTEYLKILSKGII